MRNHAHAHRRAVCVLCVFVRACVCVRACKYVDVDEYVWVTRYTHMHARAHAHSRLSHTQHTTHVDFMHSNIRSSLCPRPRICTHSPPTSVTHALGLLSRPRLTWRPRRRPIERKRPRKLRCSLSSSLALRESGLHLTCLCLYM